jgi:filamin
MKIQQILNSLYINNNSIVLLVGLEAAVRLGVQPILTAKEMCDPEVDHIGIMAYAAYFRNFKPSKTPAERVVMSSPPKNVYVGSEVHKLLIHSDMKQVHYII